MQLQLQENTCSCFMEKQCCHSPSLLLRLCLLSAMLQPCQSQALPSLSPQPCGEYMPLLGELFWRTAAVVPPFVAMQQQLQRGHAARALQHTPVPDWDQCPSTCHARNWLSKPNAKIHGSETSLATNPAHLPCTEHMASACLAVHDEMWWGGELFFYCLYVSLSCSKGKHLLHSKCSCAHLKKK